MAERGSADVRLRPLGYERLWDNFTSQPFSFDRVIDVRQRSVTVVEFRNTLSTSRTCALDASSHGGSPDFVAKRCALHPIV